MLQAGGEHGELWWVSDPIRAEVPLVTRDGWEWVPREDTQRWWQTVPLVLDNEVYVETDPVSVPTARVTTQRCLLGHSLTALVYLYPLSLALTAPRWELHVETRVMPQTMGASSRTEPVSTRAVLSGTEAQGDFGLSGASQGVLARLRSGQMAFQGLCTVKRGIEGLSLTFLDGVMLG